MSETETFWREQLEQLAETESGGPFDVRQDIERGRSRMLRRRVAVAGGGLLVGAVVLGTGLVLGGGDPTGEGVGPLQPAGSGPTAVATYHEPETTIGPSATPSADPTPALDTRERAAKRAMENAVAGETPFGPWRNELFRTTRSVLDPQGRHLDYATRSLQSGYGPDGITVGIKMGWTNPAAEGQGMVQVEVTSQGGTDDDLCGDVGLSCSESVEAQGGPTTIGRGSDGQFVVVHRRPDGLRVLVLVDPLFGNNSRTPVAHMGVTEADVYRLVQDDRLDLPG